MNPMDCEGSPSSLSETASTRAVGTLIDQAIALLPRPSTSQERLLVRLRELASRLCSARLQVAVVGQFKRGKSSLLNTLLGIPVLPTGVVPLTAVTTVLTAGVPRLRLEFLDGHAEELDLQDHDGLRLALASLVSEEGNPGNKLGLRRVVAHLAAPWLTRGIVFIDTPGIGSTLRHNTEAAIAALPECDVALFVVSPDPPITTLELDYLAQVRSAAARIMVVLNKCDMQEPAELVSSIRYLRQVLVGQAGLVEATPIFLVSARDAQRARAATDSSALEASGLPELERALEDLLQTEGAAVLALAIARKSADLVSALRLETEIAAQAWRLPITELEGRIAAFEAGLDGLLAERTEAVDRIAGDQRRLFAAIEERSVSVADDVRERLGREILLHTGERLDQGRQRIATLVPELFSKGGAEVTVDIQNAMGLALHRHQRRIEELIASLRQRAGSLMEIRMDAEVATEGVEPPTLRAWVADGRVETIARLLAGFVERLLPAGLRHTRWEHHLQEEAEAIIIRNTEALRWTLRRGTQEAVRRFISDLDDRLESAIDAIRNAMNEARTGQNEAAGTREGAARTLDRLAADLSRVEQSLRNASDSGLLRRPGFDSGRLG